MGKLLNITFFGGYKVVNKGVYSEIHGNSVDLSFFYHSLNPPDMSPEAVADYLGIPQNSVTVESLSTYPEFWCYVDENQTEAIIKKLQCAPVFDHFKPYSFATPSKNARKTNRKKKVKTLLSNNSLTITGFPKGICFTDIADVLTPFGNIKLLQFVLIDNEMQLRIAFMQKQSAEKAYHQLTEYKGNPLTVKYFTRTGKTVATESTSNLQVTPSQTSNRPLQETPLVQVTPILFTPPENETQKSTPFFESPAF
ncbi:hypothetical protein TRFO_33829 [Tritrichomonas foetus]|uniref:RRM domain-containing protein n=1 Tax=Tritrichomonas foetus TaxID=1144522 RepID=A0A1J4JKP7_9EUKA|nr:hypothetical protein TRFO_33829 [Tritrichomonas foetus]|eukprot:OHS99704.1 hypothetical protein TRFO_33829 [Tritrichomonas foetus]